MSKLGSNPGYPHITTATPLTQDAASPPAPRSEHPSCDCAHLERLPSGTRRRLRIEETRVSSLIITKQQHCLSFEGRSGGRRGHLQDSRARSLTNRSPNSSHGGKCTLVPSLRRGPAVLLWRCLCNEACLRRVLPPKLCGGVKIGGADRVSTLLLAAIGCRSIGSK